MFGSTSVSYSRLPASRDRVGWGSEQTFGFHGASEPRPTRLNSVYIMGRPHWLSSGYLKSYASYTKDFPGYQVFEQGNWQPDTDPRLHGPDTTV